VKLSLLRKYEDHALVSAKTGEGIGELKECLQEFFIKLNAQKYHRNHEIESIAST
jgi:hypothetical protein